MSHKNYEYVRLKFHFEDLRVLNDYSCVGWKVVACSEMKYAEHPYTHYLLLEREI